MQMKNLGLAVIICGTLDILYAFALAALDGGSPSSVLQAVASGPFGAGVATWGSGGAALGLAVHFAIMSVMVSAYFLTVADSRLGELSPWLVGTLYGTLLYVVMYWIVLALRWPAIYPQTDLKQIALSLFPHVALVGLPLAFLASPRGARAKHHAITQPSIL